MEAYTKSDLVEELLQIFPEFLYHWKTENKEEDFSSKNLHSVYICFLPFLSRVQPTEIQWQLLADHLSKAVASGGERENAADTCVLEHLHQVKLNKILYPLLSKEARTYIRK